MPRLLCLFSMLFLLTASLATADTRYVYSPGDGYLNLRAGPSTSYDILKPMYNGQRVWVIGVSGNWRQVRHESGSVGWAYHTYLVSSPVRTGGTFFVNSPGDGYLNLRAGPGTGHAILRRMTHGSSVRITGSSGNWLSVVHDSGSRGWAHHRYFTSTKPPRVSPQATGADCRNIDSSPTGWYIRMYKCGDVRMSDYPACLARWREKLCANNTDPAGFLNMLMNERG